MTPTSYPLTMKHVVNTHTHMHACMHACARTRARAHTPTPILGLLRVERLSLQALNKTTKSSMFHLDLTVTILKTVIRCRSPETLAGTST